MVGFTSVGAAKLGISAGCPPFRGGNTRKFRRRLHKMAASASQELRARSGGSAGEGGAPSAVSQPGASSGASQPPRGTAIDGGATSTASPASAGLRGRGPSPPSAASGSRSSTVSQRESRRLFYEEVPQRMAPPVPWRSPFDYEIGLLFLPALVAGVLEPIQQVGCPRLPARPAVQLTHLRQPLVRLAPPRRCRPRKASWSASWACRRWVL